MQVIKSCWRSGLDKINVAILGATGTVGQFLIDMLSDHPWFEISALVASERSAGLEYREACSWRLANPIRKDISELVLQPSDADNLPRLAFSALGGPVAKEIEERLASQGHVVVSNSSAFRMSDNVPLVIPEVNPEHLSLIDRQLDDGRGFIVTNPNCVTIPLAMVLAPLHSRWAVDRLSVTTFQAVSGAGYPGISSMDILDNVVPFIKDEEEKIESETQKILGKPSHDKIEPAAFRISAQTFRVPVQYGHLLSVSISLQKKAGLNEIRSVLASFEGVPQKAGLPTAPEKPILVRDENDRPQPKLDSHAGNGMTVVVGRIRPCPVFDIKLCVLGHNTIRGAAGAALLNAELLVEKGYLAV